MITDDLSALSNLRQIYDEMLIDQKGRVVQRVRVRDALIDQQGRCRECIYFSKVGRLLPITEGHCRYAKDGPVDTHKHCALAIFKEVE
jgi:hypothetical protein